jgi:hypothetical protein
VCPGVVRIAQAGVLMRGSESSESSGEDRRRGAHRWKARPSRDAALFHHTAAAKVLGGYQEQQALEPLVHRDGASQVRCSAASAERGPA